VDYEVLKVLLVDDDEDDYVITRDLLADIPSYQVELDWTSNFKDGLQKFSAQEHNIYLLDYQLGASNGLDLAREAIEGGCREPIILLTGHGNRDVDMEAMKAGVSDYIVKSGLDVYTLDRALRYAMERRRGDMAKDELIADLREAVSDIKTLNGLLPICSSCKRIRDDSGYWNQLEKFIKEHSHAELSHSICPTCAIQLYPDQVASLKNASGMASTGSLEDVEV